MKTNIKFLNLFLLFVPMSSAFSDSSLVESLSSFYPNLTCEALAAKSDFKGDSFKFFRTEVPWYWDLLRREPAGLLTNVQRDLFTSFKGFCAGDAHPENFAIQKDSSGKPVFSINDPDDASPECPVLADFMRLLIGAQAAGADTAALREMIQTYTVALTAPKGGTGDEFDPVDFLSQGLPPASDDNSKNAEPDCSQAEEKSIAAALATAMQLEGKVKIKECKDKSKITGGSGGLPKFGVKAIRPDGTEFKVQLKGTQTSGVTAYTQKDWPASQRYPEACRIEVQKVASKTPGSVPICHTLQIGTLDAQGKRIDFMIREKDKKDQEVELAVLGPSKTRILKNEALALARIHRENLKTGTAKKYADALKNLASAPVDNSLVSLSQRISILIKQSTEELAKVPSGDFVARCKRTRSTAPSLTPSLLPSSKSNPVSN